MRCPAAIWSPAKTQAAHHGDILSEVIRAALSCYLRDRDGFLAAITPPAVDGPSQPAFSHSELPVRPWRWERPLGHERQQPQQPCTPIHSAPISRQNGT